MSWKSVDCRGDITIWYEVAAEGHFLNFHIFWTDEDREAPPFESDEALADIEHIVSGSLKWDGCMNLGGFHTCGHEITKDVMFAILRLYEIGRKELSQWDEETAS